MELAALKTFVFSGVLFVAIIVGIAFPPRYTKRILGWIAVITAIFALGMYGYGYAVMNSQNGEGQVNLLSILRTVFDSLRIFGGSQNWDKIKGAYQKYPVLSETVFWVVHLLAITTSAGTIITALGSRLLKRIRMSLMRWRDITLIFGLNEDTLDFGRELAKTDKSAILYVDHGEQAKYVTAVEQMGGLFRSDPDALSGNVRFLKQLGMKRGKRKLRIYALDKSVYANQQFAGQLRAALEKEKIHPEQTTLTIVSVNEETDNPLQACPGRYGYGSVISIQESEMVARMLIRTYPPYRCLRFDQNGLAQQDFHAVIVGFGQIGQTVLRQLVMNSQFRGSTSRIAVFAPDYEKRIGWIGHECREMLKHYRIEMYPYDGRSTQLYDYLEEHASTIQYVVICAGSEAVNLEIGERFQPFLQRRCCEAPILMCSHRGIFRLSSDDHILSHGIYTPEILCTDRIDCRAMVLNQQYRKHGDMRENWRNTSYFDRMSSRAAADFMDALLYCAGCTRAEAMENWDPQGALLENLSATEHLRWNAFHYCMGFRPMTEEEFRERCENYETAKKSDPGYRIAKDVEKRIHACIIPWEELDAYSAKENAVTGENRDYAENDRNNVRGVAKVLRAMSGKY